MRIEFFIKEDEVIEIEEIISLSDYQKIDSKGKLLVRLRGGQEREILCEDITRINKNVDYRWQLIWDSSFGYGFNYETFYHAANLGIDKNLSFPLEIQQIPYLLNYLKLIGSNEFWSKTERNLFLDTTIKRLVPQLNVVETGCRYGIWTHAAHVYGAKKSVGLDFDSNCLMVCNYVCQCLDIRYEKCHFLNVDATKFDYSEFDLVLCLGTLYNISDEDKSEILTRMKVCSHCLVEFWCVNSSDSVPRTYEHKAENGWVQYMPNRLQAELLLKRHGYVFEDITPKSFENDKLENRYYFCTPRQVKLL